jgi:hypothetical protein
MNIGFEGYTGLSWGDGLLIHDILTFTLIVVLTIFAYAFYTCYPLFEKMIRGLISLKERQNLFDTSTRESFFFNVFMRFQALFLCTVLLFLFFCRIRGNRELSIQQALIMLGAFFIILIFIYLLKRFLYYFFSRVFTSKSKYRLWNTSYHTLFYFCGIMFYLPVLWLMLDRERFAGAMILFISFFIVFRISAIYVKIRIFFDKNNGFLYLILYLCAQEIVPILFLYESLTYLHSVIESSILWQ